jgi:hypothetical protein
MNLAPIILFTFNRLSHTKQTIEALQKNKLAKDSELFIYSDGGKDEESWDKVKVIREYLKTISGFKNITVIQREKNIGLAQNIIDGVTKIVNQYGKIIVLEDDIVTSPYFLKFMNDALDFYENEKKVWHISGWNYPIDIDDTSETFLWRVMNCWGWATWQDRWKFFEKNPNKLINDFSKEEILAFNLDKIANYYEQIIKNKNGLLDTWAVFWYATIFKHNGLCLNPALSFVENIGLDSTGTTTRLNTNYANNLERESYSIVFEKNLETNSSFIDKIKLFYMSIQNNNILFSKYLNRISDFLQVLQGNNEQFILYGSGTGMDLVLGHISSDKILFVLDKDIKKHNTLKKDIKIIALSHLNEFDNNSSQIIITVFGRANEITEILINEYNINKNRIISLDILDSH